MRYQHEYTFVVPADAQGQRLDVWLAERPVPCSRSQMQRRIEEGEVAVDGKRARPGQKLRPGQRIHWVPAPVRATDAQPEPIPLDIVYEDSHLLVVNKPAGLIVHPAPGHETGTLVNALLAHCGPLPVPLYFGEETEESDEELSHAPLAIGGEHRPGIVHRLDQGTSGLLVCAKDERTLRELQKQFQTHTIQRQYWALVLGVVPMQGTFHTSYGRHPYDRKRFTARRGPKHAITHYKVLERLAGATWVEVSLETGRTHQIRVHFSESNHPVLGDPLYGKVPTGSSLLQKTWSQLTHQALHARVLGFVHPMTQQPLSFSAPPPDEFMQALQRLRSQEGVRG